MSHTLNFKNNKRLIGPILFITVSIAFLYVVISNSPKVLILHSYSDDYVWTALIDDGLKNGFKKRQYLRNKIYYMNSKHRYDKNTELFADQVIAQYDPDLILAVDDNAQHFLAKKHLDTGVNIVFAGVNGEVDRYNYIGKKNVTGIFERKSILGISFVLNALNEYNHTEDKKNITLLLDSSNSSKQDKNHLTQRDWGDFNFNIRQVETFAQWQQFIHSLARNKVDYLLVSGYRKLQTANDPNQYVDYKTVVEWTQAHSSVPIIALNIFSAQDGFALAVGSSPFEQANVSLEIIDKILIKKMTPKDIAFVTPHLYSIGINKTALKKAKYKLPVFIESFAEGTDNVYE